MRGTFPNRSPRNPLAFAMSRAWLQSSAAFSRLRLAAPHRRIVGPRNAGGGLRISRNLYGLGQPSATVRFPGTDLPGVEIVTRTATTQDGKRGWLIVPRDAARLIKGRRLTRRGRHQHVGRRSRRRIAVLTVLARLEATSRRSSFVNARAASARPPAGCSRGVHGRAF